MTQKCVNAIYIYIRKIVQMSKVKTLCLIKNKYIFLFKMYTLKNEHQLVH